MTRTHKLNNNKNPASDYSVHDPNKIEISKLDQEKRFEKLKKLITALKQPDKL